jgi:hypothetical protein
MKIRLARHDVGGSIDRNPAHTELKVALSYPPPFKAGMEYRPPQGLILTMGLGMLDGFLDRAGETMLKPFHEPLYQSAA